MDSRKSNNDNIPLIGTPLYEKAYKQATNCPCPYKPKDI